MSSEIGLLSQSGLLHEGSDFEEWYKRVDAAGKVKYDDWRLVLQPRFVQKRASSGANQLLDQNQKKQKSSACAAFMLNFVSPTVVNRLPEHVKRNAYELKTFLPKFATPFRLLDLPEVLKHRVIEHAVEKSEPVVRDVQRWGDKVSVEGLSIPAIANINKAMRQRVLAAYYAGLNLKLEASPSGSRHTAADRVCNVTQIFVKRAGLWAVRNLRRLGVSTGKPWYESSGVADVVLTLNPSQGLRVEFKKGPAPKLTASAQASWTQHIANIETIRKLLDLRGEAIILALMNAVDPKLWEVEPR
ncbi:hypothetical protein MBLNU230_g5591t1 [Neophaeotheca triangularis]